MKRTITFLIGLGLTLNSIYSQLPDCSQLNPNSGVLLEDGISAYDKGQFERALDNLIKILPGDTNYFTAQYELGLVYGGLKDYKEQEKIARRLLHEKQGNPVQNYNMLGNSLDDQELFDEAVLVFDEALVKYPNNYLLHFNKGISLFRQKKYAEAEQCFINSARLNPIHQTSHYFLGVVNLLAKRYIQGIMAMQYALILNTQSSRYSSGISILDQASNLQVPTPEEEIKLSGSVDDAGDFEEVNAIYSSLIALNDKYKPKKLPNLRVIKQMSLFFDNIESVNTDNKSFYTSYYLPIYTSIKKNKLVNAFFAELLKGIDKPEVVKLKNAEKKNFDKLTAVFADLFKGHVAVTRVIHNGTPMTMKLEYYSSGHIKNAFEMEPTGKEIADDGLILVFYENGGLYKEAHRTNGAVTGECKIYNEDGTLSEVLNLINGVEQGKATEYYSTGQINATKEYKDGVINGEVKIFYPDGPSMLTYTKANKTKNGLQRYYYSDGKLASEFNFLNGSYEGPMKEYYSNGNLEYEYNYLNGKLNGTFKNYYPDGVLKEEKNYVKGELVGSYTLYHGNGKIEYTGKYDDKSKRTGVWKEYYFNGNIKNEYTYLNGEKQGNGIEYSAEGLKHYEYNFSGGNFHSIKFFDRNGNVVGDFKEEKGILKYTYTSINGVPIYTGSMKDGARDGQWTYYFGAVKGTCKTTQFKNGEEQGEQIQYYADGVIRSKYNFKDGLEEGRSLYYFEDGKTLKSLYCCSKGNICGNFTGYFPNGSKRIEMYYLNGNYNGPYSSFDLMGRTHNVDNYENGAYTSTVSYDSLGNPLFELYSLDGLVPYIKKYPNGQIRVKGKYLNGKLHDSLIYYFPDGRVRSSSFYQNGRIEGTLTIYNHLGVKVEERTYANNRLHGFLITYYENGKLSRKSQYVNGTRYGKTEWYYPNGVKEYDVDYEDGSRQGRGNWYNETGAQVMTMDYFDDVPEVYCYKDKSSNWVKPIRLIDVDGKLLSYHPNGKKHTESTYSGNFQNGTSILYYSNGSIFSKRDITNGVYNGKSLVYFTNGKLAESKNFWMDERHGLQQYYNENGSLLMELNYEYGNLNGACKYYDSQGKLKYTVIYYQDEAIDVIFK